MRVAVIGAGVTGLVAALRVGKQGHECDVYERWPGLGGQAATIDVGGGHTLERYYHHWFTSDRHAVALCEELGLGDQVEWHESSVAFFADGAAHAFTTPLDLLRFKPLRPLARVRMGMAVVNLQRRHPDVEPFEGMTARAWIEDTMGPQPYAKVWGPLLRGKFGSRADDISMGWLHGKLTQRRKLDGRGARKELLGYPRDSFEPLFAALAARIESRGGRVLIDRPARSLARDGGGFLVAPGAPESFRRGHDPRGFDAAGDPARYDAVLATVPSDVFTALLEPELAQELSPGYQRRLESIDYHAAVCLLLELDRPFGRFYWTNIADLSIPFVGLVEHTKLVGAERYDGRHFLYVANYVDPSDPLASLGGDALLEAYDDGLRKVNPAWSRSWVRERWLHREPAAQPIVDVGYHERIPALQTGVKGLVLANTTQVYPEDRGTSYAVRLGDQAAAAILRDEDAAAASART